MAVELKIWQMTIDGLPHTCPDCASTVFTLDGRGFSDSFPAWGNCPSSHSWEDLHITVGTVKQILAASTGRQRAGDEDTFEIEVGGAVIAGVLYPDVILDDLKKAGGIYWQRIIRPALRRQKRQAVHSITRPAKNAAAGAKAAAIGAAWGLQAGGHTPDPDYQPEPVNACPACSGKGSFDLDTSIHSSVRTPCSVCTGTGEI